MYRMALALATLLVTAAPPAGYAQVLDSFTNLGVSGGMVEDLAFVPGAPGVAFAATYEGDGLYRTGDGGATWQPVAVDNDAGPADTFKNNDVFQVAVAPSDPQVIYVVHNDWVDISSDGGFTWQNVLNATMQRDCVDCGGAEDDLRLCQTVAVDPSDPAVAYVGTVGPHDTYTGGAIYKTTDLGLSWQKLNGGVDFDFAVKDLSIDPQNPTIVWAVTSSEGKDGWGGSLYRSADGGVSWTKIASVTPNSAFGAVAVKPNDSNTVFTASGFGVIKHTFAGEAWGFDWLDTTRIAHALAFDPQDPDTLYASWRWPIAWGGAGDDIGKISRTTDGGVTWEVFEHGYEFNTLAVDPSDSEVLLAGDFTRGVFRSADHGQTWSPYGTGVSALTVYDVAVDPADTKHLLAGTAMALLERSSADAPWTVLLDAPIRSIRFLPTDSLTIYAGTSRRGLAKTFDGGQTWSYTPIPGPAGSGNNDVTAIAIDPTDTDTLFVAVYGLSNYGEVYKSTDGGQSLTKVLDGVNLAGESYPFNAVVIDPFDPDHVFAGGGRFYIPKILGDLWESTDGGASWARASLRDDTEETRGVIVNALLMDPSCRGVIYAGAGFSSESFHPLYVSSDGGSTWTPQHEGFPMNSYNAVKDLEFHREDSSILYAATLARGIHISANRGASWANLGTPEFNVRAIAVGSLYGATEGGLYQLSGTGCLFGNVADSDTAGLIDGADVFTGLGLHSTTLGGEYLLISPAGIHTVTATAPGYADATHREVTLPGGDAVRRDFSLPSGSYAIALADTAAPADDRVLSFGNVSPGSTAEIGVTVTNRGDATFLVGAIDPAAELVAPFTLREDTCTGASLPPGDTCTFRLGFAPLTETGVGASFTVTYGDAQEGTATLQVYGNGNTLTAPILTEPAAGAEVTGDTVAFQWTESAVGPAPGHYLYCSTDPTFDAAEPYSVALFSGAGLSLAGAGLFALLGAPLPACRGAGGAPPDSSLRRCSASAPACLRAEEVAATASRPPARSAAR